jgi:uncharacterized protein YggE
MKENLTLLQKAGVFALVCAGVLALSGVWYILKSGADQDKKTFAVQGKGEVDVIANKATINTSFVGEGKTPEEASQKLTDQANKAFAELEKVGAKKETIKTKDFSSNPKYEYCYSFAAGQYPDWCKNNPNQNRIVGYEATENLEVKISDDKALVEKVLGMFATLGARNVNGPNWEVDNDAAIAAARELAVKEARTKAESIAKSLGMRLGKVQYYSEDQVGAPMPVYFGKGGAIMSARAEMAPAAMDMAIPVSQGTDKAVVNVNITYELQ